VINLLTYNRENVWDHDLTVKFTRRVTKHDDMRLCSLNPIFRAYRSCYSHRVSFNRIMPGTSLFSTNFDFLSKKINMKAKTFSLAIFSLVISFATYAQTSDAEAEAMANLLGVQKKEIIMKLISIPEKDSVTFWKL